MYVVMHKYDNQYLRCRDGIYYFVRCVPCELRNIYTSDRISMSLKTKFIATARRVSKSIDQRLEDYWMGIRLQKLDIPAKLMLELQRLNTFMMSNMVCAGCVISLIYHFCKFNFYIFIF